MGLKQPKLMPIRAPLPLILTLILTLITLLLHPCMAQKPTPQPTRQPSGQPSRQPSGQPSRQPSSQPSASPSSQPSTQPTVNPTREFGSESWSQSGVIEWIPDYINITHSDVMRTTHWNWNITLSTNGKIYQDKRFSDFGHFRVVLNVRAVQKDSLKEVDYLGYSNCINIGAADTLKRQLNQIRMLPIIEEEFNPNANSGDYDFQENKLSDQNIYSRDLFDIQFNRYDLPVDRLVVRDHKDYNWIINYTDLRTIRYSISFGTRDTKQTSFGVLGLLANISYDKCSIPKTISSWDDKRRWVGNRVPGEKDSVRFPKDSGLIVVGRDIRVKSLIMYDGVLVTQESSCPPGWISGPNSPQFGSANTQSYSSHKCYKLFENSTSYEDADKACRYSGESSMDSRLVHINDYEELDVTKRICRGNVADSTARQKGCWIGLKFNGQTRQFAWLDNNAIQKTNFRNWRRFMGEDNRTVSEGESTPGELCVGLVPWQEDPLIDEQGAMNDISCQLKKPYICQLLGNIKKHTITVEFSTLLQGGTLQGGNLVLNSWNKIMRFTCSESCSVIINPNAKLTLIETLMLIKGSTFIANSPVIFRKNSFMGEVVGQNDIMQSLVIFNSDVHTQTDCAACDLLFTVTINSRCIMMKKLVLDDNVIVLLKQGGDLSSGSVDSGTNSSLVLGGYGTKLSSFDAFDLTLGHRGPVVGEYLNDIPMEQNQPRVGVFRLVVKDSYVDNNGVMHQRQDTTACIPYNATSTELVRYLKNFPGISSRGGVSIRRYGQGENPDFYYGYSHRLEIDAAYTKNFGWGPLSIELSCYGIRDNCGCAETVVPLKDINGIFACPKQGNISRVDPKNCVIPPSIAIARVSTMGFTDTLGSGDLIIGAGVHRLPPTLIMGLTVIGGRGLVSADIISYPKVETINVGTLIATGTSWNSWDSANNIFKEHWEYKRGFVTELSSVSTFTMTLGNFKLNGLGSFLTAAPNAILYWNSGSWDGGIIGGRSTIYITGVMDASGSNKALKYDCTLWFLPGSQLDWHTGNISLADGADLIMEGTFNLKTLTEKFYIGQAAMLEAPAVDKIGNLLLAQESGRNWHGYFDLTLPAEMWGGWYENPLCGGHCLDIDVITIQKNGTVICADNATVGFRAPINMIGYSKLTISYNGKLELFAGGICGNKVVMDMFGGSAIELSSGSFLMQATCTVRGEGELLIVDGDHYMAFAIDAHITIDGGKLVWPLSRGTGKKITFNGGLLLQNIGTLEVQPFSTQILITREVVMQNDSLIQFPMIGIAAQASPSDRQDAPDSSPRGIFSAQGTWTWLGGTLRGKADFNALTTLYLDGDTKYIRSLAKLVNHGHCEWGSGDLITDDNGGLLSLGTTQVMYDDGTFSASNMFRGTIIPVENGGDQFSKNFHSYDMDEGRLTYEEYVTLRTRFVSRAPPGWNEKTQKYREIPIAL